MTRNRKRLPLHKGTFHFCTLLLGILLIFPGHARPTEASAGDKTAYQRVTIQGKAPGVVFVGGARFRVTESTLILDILGKQIPLCDLPVPCEADMEYQKEKGASPVCLVIETRRLLMGANIEGKSGKGD